MEMPEDIVVEKRPFHEAIVDFLQTVTTPIALDVVCELLQTTKIPDQHAGIVADAVLRARNRVCRSISTARDNVISPVMFKAAEVVAHELTAQATAYKAVKAEQEANQQGLIAVGGGLLSTDYKGDDRV